MTLTVVPSLVTNSMKSKPSFRETAGIKAKTCVIDTGAFAGD